jgi:hypothetical protein
MGLGALVVLDILTRLRDVTAFYTDLGVMPRLEALHGRPAYWYWSLFHVDGSRAFAIALFVAFFPAALALLLGYRTRAATVACWLYLHSVQMRNLEVCDSGDTVLRLLCFFLMFIDSGGRFSLDVALGRRTPAATVPALPLCLLRFQIALIYAMAVSWKTGSSWRDGTAVLRAMQNSDFARPLAEAVAKWPGLCSAATYGTLLLEFCFPLLVLSRRSFHRAIAIGFGLLLHGGIFATMRVGVFSLALPVSYLAFVHPTWLDRIPRLGVRLGETAKLRGSPEAGPSIAFPRWLGIVLVVQMAFIVWDQIGIRTRRSAPWLVRVELRVIGLWQHWNVFSPDPPDSRIAFRAEGIRTDGTTVEALAAAAPRMLPDRRFFYSRWYKYRSNVEEGDAILLRSFAKYICRRYNHDHSPPLDHFSLWMHVEPMDLPDTTARPPKDYEMIKQPCTPGGGPVVVPADRCTASTCATGPDE